MTDESKVYPKIGTEFANHGTVNHSAGEYTRLGNFVHTNTIESAFAILKRGVFGNFHHVSEAHLHRYLSEFDFRYNHREALGCNDEDRTNAALKGSTGKRLTYRRTGEARTHTQKARRLSRCENDSTLKKNRPTFSRWLQRHRMLSVSRHALHAPATKALHG